jgi:hypothetical protein
VVVAVVLVWVMQTSVDEIVDVVAVGDWLVAAVVAVGVILAMSVGRRGVAVGVLGVDLEGMLVDVIVVRVVQVAVVEVVDVVVVSDGGVAAVGSVNVGMLGVDLVVAHAVTVPHRARADKQLGARNVLTRLRGPGDHGWPHRVAALDQPIPVLAFWSVAVNPAVELADDPVEHGDAWQLGELRRGCTGRG